MQCYTKYANVMQCKPTFAIIFMSEFKDNYIYPFIKDKSISYLRFTSDIFLS